jgi:hypothetical protein
MGQGSKSEESDPILIISSSLEQEVGAPSEIEKSSQGLKVDALAIVTEKKNLGLDSNINSPVSRKTVQPNILRKFKKSIKSFPSLIRSKTVSSQSSQIDTEIIEGMIMKPYFNRLLLKNVPSLHLLKFYSL